jgi:predicted DNA-binding transcriptional regulator AlpA
MHEQDQKQTPMPDISGYRMVSLEEVAILFGTTPTALKQQVHFGTFPVKPKMSRPKRWSSVELREWFEDGRKRSV